MGNAAHLRPLESGAGGSLTSPRFEAEVIVEIAAVQQAAWENKLAKGFNVTDVALEFGLLTAEVGEAFTAWLKRLPDLGEELADVLIYVTALAEMTGVDLGAEVDRKLAINARREYRRDARGVLHRVSDQPSARP